MTKSETKKYIPRIYSFAAHNFLLLAFYNFSNFLDFIQTQSLYQFYMRLRSIRVAAIHELPLQCVVLHQSYKAHLQTEMVLVFCACDCR